MVIPEPWRGESLRELCGDWSCTVLLREAVTATGVDGDRLLLLILARMSRRWRDALQVVNPETLLRWHRDLFKFVWRRRSLPRGQPMRLAPEVVVTLIQAMVKDNALWGAERWEVRGRALDCAFQ